MKLLAIDTATELCSAALWLDGGLSLREAWAPREHGTLILPMIDELLSEAQLAGTALDAIAFGRGPGAFTGLRLAAAVAQGLGFAWELPLIPISDLRALAAQALPPGTAGRALVCQDARMHEVYWACFERMLEPGEPGVPTATAGVPLQERAAEAVSPPDAVVLPEQWARSDSSGGRPIDPPCATVCALGSGFAAYPQLQSRLQGYLRAVRSDLRPHAREIAVLAVEAGLGSAVAPDLAEPVYLRDRVTDPPPEPSGAPGHPPSGIEP